APFVALAILAVACAAGAGSSGPIVLGAVYPTAGGQGPGGIDEYRGVQLAAEYVNARGGVLGRQVQLRLQPADSSDPAARAIKALHLPLAGTFPYQLLTVKYPDLVRRIKAAGVQDLLVVAYLDDGVGLRKEMVKQKVPLVASIGTSSSYCMPGFGKMLDEAAVGLYASDKPDGDVLNPDRLSPDAAAALIWARMTFKQRYQEPMTAAALTGFSGAYALLTYVLPKAPSLSTAAISAAARAADVRMGSLPNGSGLHFAPHGS